MATKKSKIDMTGLVNKLNDELAKDFVEEVEQTSETNVQSDKIFKFRANLKIQRQINPALRKVQVAKNAITILQKKSIVKDFSDFLGTVNSNLKQIEDFLLAQIPD
ncbi:hypothetical protein D9V86_08955 [Bacteroidetes/Chlorobi group bacterium ChocPot_Mid]|nr:MAG: hypothetical protein D9V86_08955 [Bacteroidetes/Chlorobi group bacterium ChocPot_Mid]